jgi:hypothetical protein
MGAFAATNDSTYLRMAQRIADLIINGHAAANGWRLPEYLTNEWSINRTYAGDPMLPTVWHYTGTLAWMVPVYCSNCGSSAVESLIG